MAHTHDTKVEERQNSNDPVTANIDPGASATLLVAHIFTTGSARAGADPTYNSLPMIQAGTTQDSGEVVEEVWYMLAPPVDDNYEFSCGNTGSAEVSVVLSTYIASGGTSYFDKVEQATGSSTTPTVDVTPSEDDAVIIDAMGTGDRDEPSGNSQVLLYAWDTGSEGYAAQYALVDSVSLTTMSYTTRDDDWGIIAACFNETAAAVDVTPAEIFQEQIIDASVVTVEYLITPSEAYQDQVVDASIVTVEYVITPAEVVQLQVIDECTVTAEYSLTPTEVVQEQITDESTVTVEYLITPAEMYQDQAIDESTVSIPGNDVTPTEMYQEQFTDECTVTTEYLITPAEAYQDQVIDACTVSAGYVITSSEMYQVQIGDACSITAEYLLTVSEMVQEQFVDACVVIAAEKVTVTPTEAYQVQVMDEVMASYTAPFFIRPLALISAEDRPIRAEEREVITR